MLFNSHVFLFAFLPITLLGFFFFGGRDRPRAAGLWLIAASLFFYGWWNPRCLALIVGSVLFNYQMGVWIADAVRLGRPSRAHGMLALGVTTNLALLGYFKYAQFLVGVAGDVTGAHWRIGNIALPLAISFFTFTQIAYLVDARHGRTREYNLQHYALFVTFFPHLIAGPIVLYRSLMPQFAQRETYRFHADNFLAGLTLFTCGLAKKVIIADGLSPVANVVFNHAALGALPGAVGAWVGAVAYTLQLYFDFSGYSDMAIGLARMFNTRFPLNFDSPYKARDIVDFWRRWHITLSTFLRDHLYIPLGGNRYGVVRRYLNLFLTMLLGGLWHGAGWTFLVWGGLHGIYLCINHLWLRIIGKRAWAQSPPARFVGWAITLFAVIIGWIVFRAASLSTAWAILLGMAGRRGIGSPPDLKAEEAALLVLAAAIALFAPNTNELFALGLPPKETAQPRRRIWRYSSVGAVAIALLFFTSVLHLSRISEFLYFQF
ncbi:MAG TPA: MBOAT family protein [Chthoniobacteraceae bacterium]